MLAAPVVDTIKVVGEGNKVLRTLDRASLWAAQTPQFATARDIRAAHAEAVRHDWPRATDDAALLERYGNDVVVVEPSAENVKVTHPADLPRAEAIAQTRDPIVLAEEDVFLVECFVDPQSVDAVMAELESRAAHIDAVERDLPNAVAIRAFAGADALRGFGRSHALAGEDALFTTHLSHVVQRT